jgi:hypothetical protein
MCFYFTLSVYSSDLPLAHGMVSFFEESTECEFVKIIISNIYIHFHILQHM